MNIETNVRRVLQQDADATTWKFTIDDVVSDGHMASVTNMADRRRAPMMLASAAALVTLFGVGAYTVGHRSESRSVAVVGADPTTSVAPSALAYKITLNGTSVEFVGQVPTNIATVAVREAESSLEVARSATVPGAGPNVRSFRLTMTAPTIETLYAVVGLDDKGAVVVSGPTTRLQASSSTTPTTAVAATTVPTTSVAPTTTAAAADPSTATTVPVGSATTTPSADPGQPSGSKTETTSVSTPNGSASATASASGDQTSTDVSVAPDGSSASASASSSSGGGSASGSASGSSSGSSSVSISVSVSSSSSGSGSAPPVPDISVPDISIPDISIPKVSIPDISIPDIWITDDP